MRQRPSCANRADSLRVRAIRKLEPILGVSLESDGLHLDGEIDIVGREGFSGINGLARQLRVVEDFERDTDGNALVWDGTGARGGWNSSCPQKHRGVKWVALH